MSEVVANSESEAWSPHGTARVQRPFSEARTPWYDEPRYFKLLTPPPWTVDAACIGSLAHEHAFTHRAKRVTDAAKRICARCPVLELCIAQVMRLEGDTPARMRFGISGGMTPHERSALYERGGGVCQEDATNVSSALTDPLSA